ncbi:MAG: hypothetical protein AABX72_05135 [Nanoarchaeota archaeon]
MVLDQILLAMDLLTLLFALVTLVYLKRNREYERLELESGLNALLFGMFFLFISLIITTAVYFGKAFSTTLELFFPEIQTYLGYLQSVSQLALLPLFAVCFLVAILLVNKHLPRAKKTQKEE